MEIPPGEVYNVAKRARPFADYADFSFALVSLLLSEHRRGRRSLAWMYVGMRIVNKHCHVRLIDGVDEFREFLPYLRFQDPTLPCAHKHMVCIDNFSQCHA
jgi:hypothetical protein